MPPRLGILLSGAGSTYANLAEAIRAGALQAEIAVVVSTRPDAGGLAIARQQGHPAAVAVHADETTRHLREHRAEWVVMCGYMKFWDPPTEYVGKTVNIHPSLLPAFGGKGMYGARVHEAVLRSGERVTGCTVHWVRGSYDSGQIIAQSRVDVRDGDTVASLQARVQAAERELYPRVLAQLLSARLG